MISISGLTKAYGALIAVDGVSFDISSGECFALLGLNGAGKSTLIGMLSTALAPTSGTAKLGGFDIIAERGDVRKIINISPQESAVASNLTVRENLELIAALYGFTDGAARANELILRFDLTEKADVRCKKLSGGQLRRVSIALAMITEPSMLFLDEPTLGLDVKSRRALWKIIESLKGERTVLLTTHYLEEAEHLADRVGIISRGRIKAIGTPSEIIKQAGADSFENAFLELAEEENA